MSRADLNDRRQRRDSIGRRITPSGTLLPWLENAVKTAAPEVCVLWPFSLTTPTVEGRPRYGRIMVDGQTVRAHQLALILSGRPRPTIDGQPAHALHSCDVPACVNPHHLRWGTHQQNVQDAVERGLVLRGEQRSSAKLSAADIPEIRRRVRAGESHRSVADSYDVHPTQVTRIMSGEQWAHVPDGHVASLCVTPEEDIA